MEKCGNVLSVFRALLLIETSIRLSSGICLQENQEISLSFTSFKGLKSLNLNQLSAVPWPVFPVMPNLVSLCLKKNLISTVKVRDFVFLYNLVKLDHSFCKITLLSFTLFVKNSKLKILYLQGNLLTHIKDRGNPFTTNASITLYDNPWECDCKLNELRRWHPNNPAGQEPLCQSPTRLKGEHLRSLNIDEFACLPVISPNPSISKCTRNKRCFIHV